MKKEKRVKVKNETGLHARPASQFVQKAGKFESNINIVYEEREINAKSIMGLLSLGISQNKEILIKAEGEDAETAVDSLSEFIEVELTKEDE